jgi:fumarate hydratase class II
LGYENATLVAQVAQAQNKTVRQVVVELNMMSQEEFDSVLGDVEKLVRPNG